METVFCLIGFSGNDPNFLNWSGWVRDNLGASATKIYLAGWLDLSPHRRRMLEDRDVVPIDLAHHPQAHKWPDHLRHRYATEWVLHTLERGRPYDLTYWPSPYSQPYSEIRDDLQPVVEVTSQQPKREPTWEIKVDNDKLQERVKETLGIWRHNRQLYPGWIVFPSGEEREMLSRCTDNWEPTILESFSNFAPEERLNAIRELVWRREILLEPISDELELAAEDALKSIDCQGRTINEYTESKIDWSAVREAWRTVALALVTAARFRFDDDLFDKRTEALGPFVNDHPDVYHRLRQERCFGAIYLMDFETLPRLLEDWTVNDCDSIWTISKAALLVESARNAEAAELVKHALDAIRSIPDAQGSVAGASREGWALWSSFTMENRLVLRKRWDELAALKCDAMLEKDKIARQISGSGEPHEAPAFDLGHRRVQGLRFSNAAQRRRVAAYTAIRLSEVTGLRPAIAEGILKAAAEELATYDLELAVRLILRSCKFDRDKTLERVLSRTRMALMPVDSARKLATDCTTLIEYGLTQGWVERVRVAIEVLSRLVLRLDPDSVLEIFDKALQYYTNRQDRIASHSWLSAPLKNLFERSWSALPPDRRADRVLDILSAPIVGIDGFQVQIEDWHPDPGALLGRDSGSLLPERPGGKEERWQVVVSLLIRGLSVGGAARRRAATRLLPVAYQNRLTEAEISQVSEALWAAEHTPGDSLPENIGLYDVAFLVLPEPKPSLADERFRLKWLSADLVKLQRNAPSSDGTVTVSFPYDPIDPAFLEDTLWNVGSACSSVEVHGRPFELSSEERKHIVDLVSLWTKADVTSYPVPLFPATAHDPTPLALKGITSILAEVTVPESVGEDLFGKLKKLTESGIPGFELIHGLVKTIPDRYDELLICLRMGLASGDHLLAASATSGLRAWLTASVDAGASLRPPPDDLLREIGFMVASRRSAALPQALQLAEWVFDKGTSEHRETISDLVLQGLSYLAEELRYDRDHDKEGDVDVPLLRWLCARLAQSMAQSGLRDEPAVDLWLKLGEEDPLPEVRYAVSPSTSS